MSTTATETPPALLAVRYWLLLALSFSSGIYDAVSFLSFGKVFMAFQTGNVVELGLGVAGTRPPAGPNPVTVLIALAAFVAGAALAVPVLKAFGGNRENNDASQVWPRRVSITLGVALVLQAGFLAGWLTTSSPAHLAYILVALGGFSMGLQINAIRTLHVPSISTTAFTATVAAFATDIGTWSLTNPAVRRLIGALVSLFAGACLGDVMLRHAHPYAPLVPVLVTAGVILVASVVLNPAAVQNKNIFLPNGSWFQSRVSSSARRHR
jgi:uncharacterized membrane protein YoaK (UPF0700 family)